LALNFEQHWTLPRAEGKSTLGCVVDALAFGCYNPEVFEAIKHIIRPALVCIVHGCTRKAKRDLSFGKVAKFEILRGHSIFVARMSASAHMVLVPLSNSLINHAL
jgi:hypothetical protein